MREQPLRVGVLASGRGSNFEALVKAAQAGRMPAVMAVLVSDCPEAPALGVARAHGVEALVVDPKQFPTREAHEKAVIAALEERRVGLVCLAGYMRLLTGVFVKHFEGRLLNIHPSLLPAFPGLHAQRQAVEHGVKTAGATVHFIDEGLDTGPIVLQAAVAVHPTDTEESLSKRILDEEHRIYPEAVRLFAQGRLTINGRRVHIRETESMTKVARALLSVHDKSGVVDFAKGLSALGVEILSTGGTAALLRDAGVPVIDVAQVTGFPEMLDGRVKTLHPKVHGGILARRDLPEHMQALRTHEIGPIDLVVVALYPFEQTVARAGVTLAEAIEHIDIGGPSMIRGAAKNHAAVGVITDPSQYAPVLDELRKSGGALSPETRARLALEAFRRTARYDAAIAAYLASGAADFPERLSIEAERLQHLRYGENPHQSAAFYRPAGPAIGLAAATLLHGPELSYNNLLDWSAALGLLLEFDDPAAVVIKHTNPCGVALGPCVAEAMSRAKACDPVSIYGGIVGVNRTLDMGVVTELSGILLEILFAPDFDPDALAEIRRTKKKCRVLRLACHAADYPGRMRDIRSVLGGLLVQDSDLTDLDPEALTTVSKRAPTEAEMAALRFAWRVAKHAKSNAIVLTTAEQLVGVGAGQMNRVDSARIAVMRARANGLETKGTVCASDAFFPFRDGLDVVADAGVTAVIHPGGSIRDEEVVKAADEHGIAMVTCGIRHFKH